MSQVLDAESEWLEALVYHVACDVAYPDTTLNPAEEHDRFHLRVWDTIRDTDTPVGNILYIGGTARFPSGPITFYSVKERTKFRKWIGAYLSRFRERSQYIPFKILSGEVKGFVVASSDVRTYDIIMSRTDEETRMGVIPDDRRGTRERLRESAEHLFDEWTWILQNTHGACTRIFGGWMFETNDDAVHFKLRFS
jgi:hypothetical protein